MTPSTCPSCRPVWQSCLAHAAIAAVLTLGCSGSDASDGQSDAVEAGGGTTAESWIEGNSGASFRTTTVGGAASGGGVGASGGRPSTDSHLASGGVTSHDVGPSGGNTASGGSALRRSSLRASGGRDSTDADGV